MDESTLVVKALLTFQYYPSHMSIKAVSVVQ